MIHSAAPHPLPPHEEEESACLPSIPLDPVRRQKVLSGTR
jgi:hypothetical protein